MNIKSTAAKLFAHYIHQKNQKWINNPITNQQKVMEQLIQQAKNTQFGKHHNFETITTHAQFCEQIPVKDYEQLKPYFDAVANGESNILWPGKPIYIAKTSGTTSGAKHIPLTKESMPFHISAARNAILNYIHQTGNADFVTGKMIFLQGSPILKEINGIQVGRLSGIVAHFVPKYLQKNRLPSWETNCIEDWETKVDAVVEETHKENMTVISGIPSWVQMYFEKLNQKTQKPVGDLFKNFSLFIYGGVNFEPYRSKFENLIGRKVASIELFPASEGFFAYQDQQDQKGMLLLLNSGIFYEFIPVATFGTNEQQRLTLAQVELGVNYVLVISTNAGLWGYNMGDTVQFTSLKPFRVIVSGRVKHYISAFGEHVIGSEVEHALKTALENSTAQITEFTVAPQITPSSGLPYHEWFIEFSKTPEDLTAFGLKIDEALCAKNSYYNDLIKGKVLRSLVITPLPKNAFQNYMAVVGKLGGQNKVPRLTNDRKMAEVLNN